MRRLMMLLVVVTFGLAGTAAFAATSQKSPARSPRYRITLKTTADEYEDADGKVLNGTDGTKCPPSRDVPSVKAKCWTWRDKRLGHGTYTQADVKFDVGHITWTFALKDSRGDTLTGNAEGAGVVPDPTPAHEIGHVNRFPGETYTFTGGTGRFKGASGVLTGESFSKVVAVDSATGIVHKTGSDEAAGTLTFRSKL